MIDISCLEQSLVICPVTFKKSILKKVAESNKLLNCKFMFLEGFMKNYFFDYNIEVIKYLREV